MTAFDTGRSYHSELRAGQAEQTRQGILRALAAVMAGGPAAVTIPAVAEVAGVSIPTVYRHFGDKAGLISAMVPFVGERLGMADEVLPADPSEVVADRPRLDTALRQGRRPRHRCRNRVGPRIDHGPGVRDFGGGRMRRRHVAPHRRHGGHRRRVDGSRQAGMTPHVT